MLFSFRVYFCAAGVNFRCMWCLTFVCVCVIIFVCLTLYSRPDPLRRALLLSWRMLDVHIITMVCGLLLVVAGPSFLSLASLSCSATHSFDSHTRVLCVGSMSSTQINNLKHTVVLSDHPYHHTIATDTRPTENRLNRYIPTKRRFNLPCLCSFSPSSLP